MNNVKSEAVPLTTAKTSGLAIASLILAIFGFLTCGFTAIIGLILGIVALCAIKKNAQQLKGQGLAIAGIVASAISIVVVPFFVIMMAILMPSLARARTHAMTAVSLNKARQICIAMMMYCEENDGRFPPPDNWPAALTPYLGNEKILTSRAITAIPVAPEAGRAWAMNAQLSSREIRDIKQPHRVVLIFEVEPGSPPAGGRELLPEEPRGRRGYVIGFLDSHTEIVRPERLDELIWIPGTQPFFEVR